MSISTPSNFYLLSFYCIGGFTEPESFHGVCGVWRFPWWSYVPMQACTFTAIGVCLCLWLLEVVAPSIGEQKKLQLWLGCALHMLAPCLAPGCKQCQVNTTWEQTPAGRRLKRNSVLCLGLKSSNDLFKSHSRFVLTSCSITDRPMDPDPKIHGVWAGN